MTTLRDSSSSRAGDEALIDLMAACNTASFKQPILLHPSTDRRITLLQPHADDAALSMAASLARMNASPTLITVFSESSTSETRKAEDAAFSRACGGTVVPLGFVEHVSGSTISPSIVDRARTSVDAERPAQMETVVAPAAVSHHPDHRIVHLLARDIGCRIFWEDVAFWGIYASSVDDRIMFTERGEIDLRRHYLVAVDISSLLPVKAAMLRLYRSQSDAVWRPLRYAWTAARELHLPFDYCERFFVHFDAVAQFEALLDGQITFLRSVPYGNAALRAAYLR